MSNAPEEIRNNLFAFYDQVAQCKDIYAESHDCWSVIRNNPGTWPGIIYHVSADLFQNERSHELFEKVRSGIYPEVLIATDENIRQMDPFLRSQGFYPFMAWKGMAREYTDQMQAPLLPQNVQVVTLDKPEDREQWVKIVSNELINPTLFDQALTESLRARPGIELYLLKHEGEGVSTLMAYDSGDSTGLYMIATSNSARRKGFGHMLVQQIVWQMNRQSKNPIILHATQKGEGLYAKSGFVPYNQFFLYRFLNPQP
ncbi:MAG TPA: GNAT family N-acetyltransferase [Prolixibacteraceae bacterium]|nr:GNAT family N-acetyltransferase [Prolixibacteraceae bacterium]